MWMRWICRQGQGLHRHQEVKNLTETYGDEKSKTKQTNFIQPLKNVTQKRINLLRVLPTTESWLQIRFNPNAILTVWTICCIMSTSKEKFRPSMTSSPSAMLSTHPTIYSRRKKFFLMRSANATASDTWTDAEKPAKIHQKWILRIS